MQNKEFLTIPYKKYSIIETESFVQFYKNSEKTSPQKKSKKSVLKFQKNFQKLYKESLHQQYMGQESTITSK
jgi:hypothetical protein